MRVIFRVLMALALLPVVEVHAYKVEVHAILTDAAARRSVLSQRAFWTRMGFEYVGGQPPLFPIEPYRPESNIIWNNLLEADGFVRGRVEYSRLMAFGADIEDTGIEEINDRGEEIKIAYFSRAFNHFFNPQANKKLNLSPLIQNHTSPDWMLEPALINNQMFSLLDAKAHFAEALLSIGVSREEAFGRVLQTLGHVVHHIQDMAQPQHTRLDSHCDDPFCRKYLDPLTADGNDTSIYEIYTRDIIRCGETGDWVYGAAGAYKHADSSLVPIKCLKTDLEDWGADWTTQSVPLNSYPVVDARNLVDRTPAPRDFWTNERGTGIADFSSNNFMSTDTAFKTKGYWCKYDVCTVDMIDLLKPHSEDLPHPDGQSDALYDVNRVRLKDLIELPSQVPEQFGDAHVDFVSSTFVDQYTGEQIVNPRLTSYSIFNERFTRKIAHRAGTDTGIHTVNYFNMDEYARLLMPRAVGYSAGLINYFFRYQLRGELVKIEESGTASFPDKLTVFVRIFNESGYDLTTEHHDFTVEVKDDDDWYAQGVHLARGTYHGGAISIPKGTSRVLSFPLGFGLIPFKYTGKINVVFYNIDPHVSSPYSQQARLAEAGLQFQVPLGLPCGQSISAQGGAEGYSELMSMGSEDGIVSVEFDAFTIPDKLEIKNLYGKTMYSTGGLVSNSRTGSFSYSYEHDRQLRVVVTGNTDSNTQWELLVSCPR